MNVSIHQDSGEKKIEGYFDTQTNHSIKLKAKDVILYYENKIPEGSRDRQFINFPSSRDLAHRLDFP